MKLEISKLQTEISVLKGLAAKISLLESLMSRERAADERINELKDEMHIHFIK